MNEFHPNLWAPWRMEYIESLADPEASGECFLCDYWKSPDCDAANGVVHRAKHMFVVMNRFPYTNGHLLIAPTDHKADLTDLTDAELLEMNQLVRDARMVLGVAVGAHGFNVGINLGRCAGAGLPGHLHTHVVPRWNGDTNFMAVLGDVRVIPQAMERAYHAVCNAWQDLYREGDKA